MINSIFTDLVNIRRRTSYTSASRDSFNNPIYGDPTTWPIVYTNISVRLAWSGKQMKVSNSGELIFPQGTIYIPKNITLLPEDRIITVTNPANMTGIEYVLTAIYPSYLLNTIIDHFEGNLSLPIS
jgi:hypothetical protein